MYEVPGEVLSYFRLSPAWYSPALQLFLLNLILTYFNKPILTLYYILYTIHRLTLFLAYFN